MSDDDEAASGYTFEPYVGAVYHFSHMPIEEAEAKEALREQSYIVETVNGTLAENETCVHFNRYYAMSFKDALAIATRFEMFADEVAEAAVKIRPATEGERKAFSKAYEHFFDKVPSDVLSPKKKDSKR